MFHSSPQNPQISVAQVIRLPTHPKIKPIVHHYCSETSLGEQNLQRKLKLYPKTSKVIKSTPNLHRPSSTKYIKGAFKFLKAQGSLSKLDYQLANRPIFETAYFFSKLRELSSLASLRLQFDTIYSPNISLKVLLKSLSSLKNLAHFQLSFHSFTFNKKVLKKLFASLQCLEKMKHLSLSFAGIYNFKERDFKSIFFGISRLIHLRSLQLRFQESVISLKSFASLVSKLNKLTRIKLNFPRDTLIQSQDLLNLFHNFKELKELSDISLNLQACKIVNKTNIEPLSQGLTCFNASQIRKLQLFFSKSLDDQGFLQITQTLKRFPNLTLLDLRFCENAWISSQRMSELSSILKDLASFACLSLFIPLVSKDAFDIGSLIRSSQNLKDLQLHFTGGNAAQHGPIQQLASGLKHLKALRCLQIQFSKQSSFSEEAFESLAEGLRELNLLRNLEIKFASVDVLTNKKGDSLSGSLKKLENLSELCLDFGKSNRVDDGAIMKIAQAVKNLPHLASVELGLQQKQFANVNNQGELYKMLFEVLKERKNIHQVILHLNSLNFLIEETNKLERIKDVKIFWRYSLNGRNPDP